MKKGLFVLVLVVFVMLSVSILPGDASARDGGWRGHGGGHDWGHGHGWGWGWGWGPWWPAYYPYYPYPYYPYYPYDPYYETPVVIQQQPSYVEPTPQQEEQSYWYFCTKPRGYYPYVKKCPGGWLKVVPHSTPPVDSQQQPSYVEPTLQPEKQSYWYCTKPKGYYPNVKKCPGGWQKVVYPSVPSDQKMDSESYPDLPDQKR